MKSFFPLIALLFFCTSLSAQQNTIHIPTKEALITLLKERKVPAVAVGIIDEGKVVKVYAEGKNNINLPVNEHTIFDVASLTKTITTLVTMKLVENQSWDLDAPLYPYWTDPDVQEDPRHKKLTSKHVLSHQTGFLNWRWMDESKKLSFKFEPGEKFGYSGEGYEYLRKALESKFKTSLEKLADSLVFQPLQMKKSFLVWNDKILKNDFAGNHDKEAKPYEYEKSYEANAADNLLTTISDFTAMEEVLSWD